MKFSFPVTCNCGVTFPVHVIGIEFPRNTQCPKCESPIYLVEPLGNVVGMAILGRAESELKHQDWTLAIVLAAMAIECELSYLFMKWNRVDLIAVRNSTEEDEQVWEKQWRDVRSFDARLDKVSSLLTKQSFDAFLDQNPDLLKPLHARYPASINASSPKRYVIEEFFYKRNRIVHFGKIDFQQTDAEMCLMLASILSQIFGAMDLQRRRALESKWSIRTQSS
jgi:hypothetical protein